MAPIKLFAVASQGVRLGRNAEYAKIGRIVDNGECVRYCSFELSHGLHLATNLNVCLVLAQQAAKPMRASKGVSELYFHNVESKRSRKRWNSRIRRFKERT